MDNAANNGANEMNERIKELEHLTDNNHHGEALEMVARHILEDNELADVFARINDAHTEAGFLPPSLSTVRYATSQILKRELRDALTPDQFGEVWGAL